MPEIVDRRTDLSPRLVDRENRLLAQLGNMYVINERYAEANRLSIARPIAQDIGTDRDKIYLSDYLLNELFNGDKDILIFWSIAGVGKSTAIRQLINGINIVNSSRIEASETNIEVPRNYLNAKVVVPFVLAMGDVRKNILTTRGEENTKNWRTNEWDQLTIAHSNLLNVCEYLMDFAPQVLMKARLQHKQEIGLWDEKTWQKIFSEVEELQNDPSYTPPKLDVKLAILVETVGIKSKDGIDRGHGLLVNQGNKIKQERIKSNRVRREMIGIVPLVDFIERSIDFRDIVNRLKDNVDELVDHLKEKYPKVTVSNVKSLVDRVLKSAPPSSVTKIFEDVKQLAEDRYLENNNEFMRYFTELTPKNLPENYKSENIKTTFPTRAVYALFRWLYSNSIGYEGLLVFNPLSDKEIVE